jgi:hypothetical protein
VLEGFYALYYTGRAGNGFAVIAIKDGIVTGADVTGGVYDGKYSINETKKIFEGKIKLTLPPGAFMVTGAPPSQEPSTQELPISLPLDLDQGRHVQIQTSTGPVNIALKKLRDFPSRTNH